MTLSPSTKFGTYEIHSLIGAGGMGEVYRARDCVLKRDVALKVLPAAFAQDHERMSRFKREAELLFSRGALDTTVFSFRLDGEQKEPKPLVSTGETISHARFSPDGSWIIYTASAYSAPARGLGGLYSGGGIYVQPFPGPGLRRQVTSHGNYPAWRKDGREIVYLDKYQGRDYIWSVPLVTRGGEFCAGTPTPLFPVRLPASTFGDLNFLTVSRDGSRFFIPQGVQQPDSDVIHVKMGSLKQQSISD